MTYRKVTFGTNGNDVINGRDKPFIELINGLPHITTADDAIYGLGGNDILNGKGGNDYLSGGYGDDYLIGGMGNDSLHGGAGVDQLSGNSGNDSLYGDSGDDFLRGDGGDDLLSGGAGNDVLMPGNNFGREGVGYDTFIGGSGSDVFALTSYIGLYHATIKDYSQKESDSILVHDRGIHNEDYYTFMTGNWSGTDALDTGIYAKGDLIGVVEDNSTINLFDLDFFTSPAG